MRSSTTGRNAGRNVTSGDRFEALVAEAEAQTFEGWDFSHVEGRVEVEAQPWDYAGLVEQYASRADSMIDLGTGGGEFVADLTIRAPLTLATEGWLPNVPVADRRLRPLGVHVVAVEGAPDNAQQRFVDAEGPLPFRDASVDFVFDRHEAFSAAEVARILRHGGTFLTQQVGGRNEIEVNDALGDVPPCLSPTLEEYVHQLEQAGLTVLDAQEAFPAKRYRDVGALVSFLRMIPWQYEGFSVATHRDRLREIHDVAERDGAFVTQMHRYLLEAVKP